MDLRGGFIKLTYFTDNFVSIFDTVICKGGTFDSSKNARHDEGDGVDEDSNDSDNV